MSWQRVIELCMNALLLWVFGHEGRLASLKKLANVHHRLYLSRGTGVNLDRAIELNDEALKLCLMIHEDHTEVSNNLAIALHNRYRQRGNLDDLERAIKLYTDVLEPSPRDREASSELSLLNNLALVRYDRYKKIGDEMDLELAIGKSTEAVERCHSPSDDSNRGFYLDTLATILEEQYERMGDRTDFERAIEVLTLCPRDHEDHIEYLLKFAKVIRRRYYRMGAKKDLELAIELGKDAMTLSPSRHEPPNALAEALALRDQYDGMGINDDLKDVISLNKKALALCPQDHIHYSELLARLGRAFVSQYRRKGDESDLEQAIAFHTESLALRPPEHKHRGASLNNLAITHEIRYNRMGKYSDLKKAVDLQTEALDLCPSDRTDRCRCLHNLGLTLQGRYERTSNERDLHKAIKLHIEALQECPSNHIDRISFLNSLALAFYTRYLRLGTETDLDAAIKNHTEALVLCPLGHANRCEFEHCLAIALHTRYTKLEGSKRIDSDLEHSIRHSYEALKHCPDGHILRNAMFNSLATSLYTRYQKKLPKCSGDLDEAIKLNEEALKLSPQDLVDRPTLLHNRAFLLYDRYKEMNDENDLEQAIKLHTEALELRPEGHGGRSDSVYYLSMTLLRRKCPPQKQILDLLARGSKDVYSQMDSSLNCARLWVQCGHRFGDNSAVSDAYTSITELLRHHLPIWPTVKLQYDVLCRQAGILQFPMDAAAHAIKTALESDSSGELESVVDGALARESPAMDKALKLAVELLDSGRSLLWSELQRFQEPLLQSANLSKRLAKKFKRVCDELRNISTKELRFDDLNSPAFNVGMVGVGRSPASDFSYNVQSRRKHGLLKRYKTLLNRIRKTKGLERFLLSRSFEELQAAAKRGPVIIVNSSELGSHVIIVFVDKPPSLIKLDKPNDPFRKSALRWYETLQMGMADPETSGRHLKGLARFLWENVVKGVAEELNLKDPRPEIPSGSSIQCPTRIWWCPTSFLTIFPFHAAGDKNEYFIDLYTSSYTPTLKALIDARNSKPLPTTDIDSGTVDFKSDSEPLAQGPHRDPNLNIRVLVVAQTQETSLPSANEELTAMRSNELGAVVNCLDQAAATKEAILEHLQSHSWSHFICHGRLSPTGNPFESTLELRGGNLSLDDIVKAQIPNAQFAFLAACHSAKQAGFDLTPDEALHLAGAMFSSGFRSVVGTMWKMKDRDGPKVARLFYEEMLKKDESEPELETPRHTRAAYALRKVAKQLKEEKVGIYRWANYIHFGA